MAFGPVGLREHVVDNVECTGVEHIEHFIQQEVLAVPGVCENVVVFFA